MLRSSTRATMRKTRNRLPSQEGEKVEKLNLPQEFFRSAFHYDTESGKLFNKKKFDDGISKPIGYGNAASKERYVIVCARINGKNVQFYAHRVAWIVANGDIPDGMQIDHINGSQDDNRLCNLRCVTGTQNAQNLRGPRKTSRSGILGVFPRSHGRWGASIKANGKRMDLGIYNSIEEAHQAYVAKKRQVHQGCTI